MELELVKKTGSYSVDVFKESWLLSMRQFLPLFVAWAISLPIPLFLVGLGAVIGLIGDHLMGFKGAGWCFVLGTTVPALMIGFLWAGWVFVTLKIARGIKPRFTDLFRPIGQMCSGFILLLIGTIAIGIGTALFVLPGAFLFLKFQLAPYYIVDRDFGPLEALKQSWKDTNALFVPLALLDLGFWGVQTISGPTVIVPFLCFMASAVATALVYSRWLVDEDLPELTDQLFQGITGSPKSSSPPRDENYN